MSNRMRMRRSHCRRTLSRLRWPAVPCGACVTRHRHADSAAGPRPGAGGASLGVRRRGVRRCGPHHVRQATKSDPSLPRSGTQAYWYDAASTSAALALVWDTSRSVLVAVRAHREGGRGRTGLTDCARVEQAVQYLWARVRRPTALPGPHAALLASVRQVTTDQEELVVLLHRFLGTQPHEVAQSWVALLDSEAASRRVAVEHALDWVLAGYRLLLPFLIIYVIVSACSGGGGQEAGPEAAPPAAVHASRVHGQGAGAATEAAAHRPARVEAPASRRALTAPHSAGAAAAPAGAEEQANKLALTPTRRSTRRAL